ncbi:hypothetical protein NP493_53g12052 [Ridgeia piscesae]|uniref:Uncharacterized protein n=1 Tax=Ridgeia piscesae TaxID=27915 RepID=A0AAD9UJA5_RIDPI|nr:hypothetical protein NP493_53g12052 [Ridgeia piscesae]
MREVERDLLGKREDAARVLKELKRSNMKTRTEKEIWSGANTTVPRDVTAKGNTNYFEEQQYQLKRELEQKMSCHAEVMENRRQVSHDSIQQLQRQLNNLEQVTFT